RGRHDVDRIARHQADEAVDDEAHDEKDDERLSDAPQHEADHRAHSLKWQAAECEGRAASGSKRGTTLRQMSCAKGQRGWKTQAVGGSSGLGISPLIERLRRRPLPMLGMESRSARVYGGAGCAKMSSRRASSMMRPR